jgi:iron-sulfur cluster repair protein YtfE (RIC family)
MENKPIKRHESLKPLSRDHHQGLLLCWKIRQGFKKNINPERIKRYADWFWENHLVPHFEAEEKHVFPVLEKDNPLIMQALAEHQRLKSLFDQKSEITVSLGLIEKELDNHIRFEERVLFNEIERAATPEQLAEIESHHGSESCDDWEDEFWK